MGTYTKTHQKKGELGFRFEIAESNAKKLRRKKLAITKIARKVNRKGGNNARRSRVTKGGKKCTT